MATNNTFYPFGYGFHNNSGDSIDDRLVLTKAQMKVAHELSSGLCMPDKYFCLCSEDKNLYIFDSTNTVDDVTGKFRALAGGASIDEYIRSATIDGNKLTLKKKDDSTVVYETKTINNQSLVGTGNVDVQPVSSLVDKTSEASTALNSLTDNGVYKVAHASDKPTNTSESGTLSVNKLQGTKLEQTWYSDTNYAYRVFDTEGPAPEVGFYVNDVLQTPDEDGNVYISVKAVPTTGWTETDLVKHLRGTLDGQVIIENDAAKKRFVTLVLDGVTINTATTSAIYCNNSTTAADDETRICLEISENKINTLTSTATATEVSSYGCIHCESDMYISGTGFLNITCANGHGIKATDISISGKPHITVDAKHDGIHGKSLKITNGDITIKKANDAFSAGSDNHSGVICVSGGKITVEQCTQNVFQSKTSTAEGEVAGRIRIYYHPTITLLEGFSTAAVNNADSIEVWNTVTWNKPSATTINGLIDISTKYAATPTVYDETNRQYITATNNLFNITTAGDTYTCTGNFTGYRIEVPNAGKTLLLNGVYCKDESDNTDPFIYYHAGEGVKNVKIICSNGATDNTINYIYKKNGYVVKSQNNINMNKGSLGDYGDIYMCCPNGYVLYAENECRIQNDGAKYFTNSKYGIRANLVNIADEYTTTKTDYTANKQTFFYACDNTDYDISLYHHTYGTEARDGQINITADCYGTAYLGKVVKEVATETIKIMSEVHKVNPTAAEEFQRHPFVYVYEDSDEFTDINNNVIEIDPNSTGEETVSSWKVYAAGGDCYTKSQSDERYTLQATYAAKIASLESTIEALTLRVSALEGTALNPTFDDTTGSLTLSHTSISDEGALNLNRSEIDDNGNVTLK